MNVYSLSLSPIYALILLVEIVQRGSSKSILPSLPTGKKFASKRIHPKFRQDPCPGLWTLFFVLN